MGRSIPRFTGMLPLVCTLAHQTQRRPRFNTENNIPFGEMEAGFMFLTASKSGPGKE